MYKLNDLSMITGLTERTLRTYLKNGVLLGEKESGVWHFSTEQVSAFLEKEVVKAAMKSNRSALLYDFMNDVFAKENAACLVLHLCEDNPWNVADFFCNAVNKRQGLKMRFDRIKGQNQVILVGAPETVSEILNEYMEKNKTSKE